MLSCIRGCKFISVYNFSDLSAGTGKSLGHLGLVWQPQPLREFGGRLEVKQAGMGNRILLFPSYARTQKNTWKLAFFLHYIGTEGLNSIR